MTDTINCTGYYYWPTYPAYTPPGQGWQCPLCKVVYAPGTVACYCQAKPATWTTSTSTVNVTV